MAITTVNGAIAGQMPTQLGVRSVIASPATGRPFTLWSAGPNPVAGTYSTALAGANLDGSSALVSGQIYRRNPISGNAYVGRYSISPASSSTIQAGTAILADRIWHNGGFTITSTAAQTINSATFPARDINGSTNGDGILLGLEVSAAVGAATPTVTVSYTNQDGTAGRSATNAIPTVSGAVVTSFFPLGLQAGDTGVRSVQSLTLSASWVSGTINLVAYRPIAMIDVRGNNHTNAVDAVTLALPRVYDGSVLFAIYVSGPISLSTVLADTYTETQG